MQVIRRGGEGRRGEGGQRGAGGGVEQSCSDKFIELVQPTEVGTTVLYKGVEVWAVSCHKGNGEWVR